MTNSIPAPRIFIATATAWPTSARLAHRLIRNGCEVSAICPPGHALNQVRGIGRIFTYRSVRSLLALRHALTESNPDYIIPCNDGVVWQLHTLYAREPHLRPLIERSLGDPAKFPIVRSRFQLLDTAQRLGIRIPHTLPADTEDDVRAWFGNPEQPNPEVAVKVDGAWGGIGVKLVSSEDRAVEAFQYFRKKPSFIVLLKRMLVDHDPLVFWNWRHMHNPGISVQQFVEGRPANSLVACRNGKVLAALHVQVHCAQGATKAAISIGRVDNPEMQRAAELLAAELGLSGFFGLDYVLEPLTGRTWLLEMNPRATQIGHLEWLDDGSALVDALSASWTGHRPQQPNNPLPRDSKVLLFPQALAIDRDSPWLSDGIQDLPKDQPELMQTFLTGKTGRNPGILEICYRLLTKNDPIRPVIFSDTGMVSADDQKH